VVQVFRVSDRRRLATYRARDELGTWVYPADHPVGNQRGEVEVGIQASNSLPWCLRAEDELDVSVVQAWADDVGMPPETLPICPEVLFSEALGEEVHRLTLNLSGEAAPLDNREFTQRWLRQGAMNAGLAAFYYLRGLTRGEVEPSPLFDFCRQ
jgi:hypothetical protein